MKICIVTGIFPPDIGGPATYVCNLAQSLFQQKHALCVVTLGDDIVEFPFPVKRVSRKHPLPVRLIFLFGVLLRYGWRSDVWYINGLEFPAVLAGKLLRKRMVMKIVSDYAWERALNQELSADSVHEFQHKKQHWKVELHKKLRAWLARQMETVITPSRHVKNLVCGWGIPDGRVQVIYNAVESIPEIPGTKRETRERLGLPEFAHLVITVGRLIELKGIDQLIRAIVQLRDEYDKNENLQLLIVGDGPEKSNLMKLTQTLHAIECIRFVGHTDRQHVLTYLKASDLFVLNSSTEGFSHVLLEAMMAGMPVIATAVGGNPELVTHQENGILIAHGNFEELKEQIYRGVHDRALREKLIKGTRKIEQNYSWERLLQQTMKVLGGC